jgi:tRNA threonylcarbamoyladenosine biosynthesis protein TsaB
LHTKIKELLKNDNKKMDDIEGIVVFKGPGSFTGLRIGITVANALAYSLTVPVVASEDPQWLEAGLARLQANENETVAMPEYGALPHITPQKR